MTLLSEVEAVVKMINELHPEDPKVYEYWDKLTEFLSRDENATVKLLNELEDSDLVEDLSSVFEDVSASLQSKNYIQCLESLENRNPDLMLEHMVQAAKDAMAN